MYALREYKIHQLPPPRVFFFFSLNMYYKLCPRLTCMNISYIMYNSASTSCCTYSKHGMPMLAQDALNYFALFAAALIVAAHICMPNEFKRFFARIWGATFLISCMLRINFYLNEIKSKLSSHFCLKSICDFLLFILVDFTSEYCTYARTSTQTKQASRTWLEHNFPKQARTIDSRLAGLHLIISLGIQLRFSPLMI